MVKMTHFAILVAVPADEADDVEEYLYEVLAPFDENLECELHINSTKDDILSQRKFYIEQYENSLKAVDLTARPKKDFETRLAKLKNQTDEEYYHEYIKGQDVDENGNLMTSYNINSRWDWFCIGGRWEGALKTKDGKNVNLARVKDIEFDGAISAEEARKTYRKMKKAIGLQKTSEKGLFLDELDAETSLALIFGEFNPELSEDDYVKESTSFSFYSFLDKNGEWQERAECGLFGTEHDVKEDRFHWTTKFKERFIDPLDPDDILVVVDCHI